MVNKMKINKDDFNSNHFNMLMGNLCLNRIYTEDEFENELSNLKDFNAYNHLTLRIPTNDKITVKFSKA